MIDGWLIYDMDDGSAEFEGVVTPKGCRMVMESGDLDLLAVKWPGSSYYAGQGQPQNYSPGQWIVFRHRHTRESITRRLIENYGQPDECGKIRVLVTEVMRWPVRT